MAACMAQFAWLDLLNCSRINRNLEDSVPGLEEINLTNNMMGELADLGPLTTLPALTRISLLGNPLARKEHYRCVSIRLHIFYSTLTILNAPLTQPPIALAPPEIKIRCYSHQQPNPLHFFLPITATFSLHLSASTGCT
jgi:hypothetical protein